MRGSHTGRADSERRTSRRQHTSAYVSIRQHTSAYDSESAAPPVSSLSAKAPRITGSLYYLLDDELALLPAK
jgi:hypothetical protein